MSGLVDLLASPLGRGQLAQALHAYAQRANPDRLHPAIPTLAAELAAIPGHSATAAASPVDSGTSAGHPQTVTHLDAARILGCSPRTVGRRVADGTLDSAGRRITRASVDRLAGR